MQVRCVLRHCTLRVWVVPGRNNWEKEVLGEGVWELWEEEEREVCSDCVPQGVKFTLWLISEVTCHCGEFQRHLPGPSPASVAAAGKGGEQLEKGCGSRDTRMLAEKTMFSLVTSWVPTLDGMVLSWRSQPWKNRDRGTIMLKNSEVVERNPLWKKNTHLGLLWSWTWVNTN